MTFTTLTVQLSTNTLLSLVGKLRRRGGSADLSEAIADAVDFWLADSARFEPGADASGVHGYQWKSLFLPEGTILKSWSYGENNFACVEGDDIIHNGRSVSPNQFAQSFARATRNAWTDLYVRRPCDKNFTLASRLRRQLAEEAKNIRSAPPQAPLAPPEVHTAPPPADVTPPKEPRNTDREPGWDLPERRKFRYRLEDVAY